MRTMAGDQVFTVRGIMKPGGLASAFGGDLAIMDIYAAQKVFGRGRKFDRIDLALEDGVTLDDAHGEIAARCWGRDFRSSRPARAASSLKPPRRIYSLASNITSVFALFIGMFIIYNTFAIAVTQRRSEIGILRALGATRGQIRTLFLAESAIDRPGGDAPGRVWSALLMARGDGGLHRRVARQTFTAWRRAPGDISSGPEAGRRPRWRWA